MKFIKMFFAASTMITGILLGFLILIVAPFAGTMYLIAKEYHIWGAICLVLLCVYLSALIMTTVAWIDGK